MGADFMGKGTQSQGVLEYETDKSRHTITPPLP